MSDNKESRDSLERMLPHYASFSDEEKKQVLMEGGVPADTPDVMKRVVLETIAAVRKQRTADDEKRG